MMNKTITPEQVDLNLLIRHFPWTELCQDYGFAMPYPEVMMTSDRAHALYTQISGLLLPLAWEIDNQSSYEIVEHSTVPDGLILRIVVQLPILDEAWEVIGFPEVLVKRYLTLATFSYLTKELWADKPYRYFPLEEGAWLIASN